MTVAGGGTIAPGTSAGTLMIGRNSVANTSLLIGDGGATVATLAIEIDSSGADKLVFIQAASPTGSITSTT